MNSLLGSCEGNEQVTYLARFGQTCVAKEITRNALKALSGLIQEMVATP